MTEVPTISAQLAMGGRAIGTSTCRYTGGPLGCECPKGNRPPAVRKGAYPAFFGAKNLPNAPVLPAAAFFSAVRSSSLRPAITFSFIRLPRLDRQESNLP